jgi:hypothetical protein
MVLVLLEIRAPFARWTLGEASDSERGLTALGRMGPMAELPFKEEPSKT